MYTRDSTLLEKLIVEELKKLRKLPLEKKSLYHLLKEKEPSVKTEDGRHYFNREELEYASTFLTEGESKNLQLPIYLHAFPEAGRGAFKIYGDVERKLVNRIVGQPENQEWVYRWSSGLWKIKSLLWFIF